FHEYSSLHGFLCFSWTLRFRHQKSADSVAEACLINGFVDDCQQTGQSKLASLNIRRFENFLLIMTTEAILKHSLSEMLSASESTFPDPPKSPPATISVADSPVLQPSAPKEERDIEPEWIVYAQSNYEVNATSHLAGKLDPEERFQKRLESYHRQGLRCTAAAVILCHQHDFPHLLLPQRVDTKQYTLLHCKYSIGEKPRSTLQRKLNKYFRAQETHQPSYKRAPLKWQSNELIAPLLEVGEYLGEWWRSELYHDPVPYLPAHVTRPKERIRLY
ncbi:putative mrna cleavage factor family protein, partial [Cardiosporidium cionae]